MSLEQFNKEEEKRLNEHVDKNIELDWLLDPDGKNMRVEVTHYFGSFLKEHDERLLEMLEGEINKTRKSEEHLIWWDEQGMQTNMIRGQGYNQALDDVISKLKEYADK